MRRIFVVEDESIIAEDIAQTLRNLGYEVAGRATSGLGALLEIERSQPDLVLMDIKLSGGLDGIRTTSAIRKRWPIPVVYLTSHSDEATLARAKETGPYGYLSKPFSERELRTVVEVALRRQELEMELERREHWYATTLDCVGDAIIATDPSGKVTLMNRAAQALSGWETTQATGRPVEDVLNVVRSFPGAIPKELSQLLGQGDAAASVATRLIGRSGKTVEVDDSMAPIVDQQGRKLGDVIVLRDATERRRIQERLSLAERLASISTMAAGMADEINTPLAASLSSIDLAATRIARLLEQPELQASPELRRELGEVADALADARIAESRARNIVRELRNFVRPANSPKERLDLPPIIEAALVIARHLTKAKCAVSKAFAKTPLVTANEGQLAQLFASLIANAIQAGCGEGRHTVTIVTRTDDWGRAVVEIHDSGCGIEPAVLARIFDPLFMAWPAGGGKGLSLATCQSIAHDAGGAITVESQLGIGTTFSVTFGATGPAGNQEASPKATGARVLVVDDEELVGRTIRRVLGKLHEPHVETDPRRGLERAATEEFDVILCDITMPVMSGMDFYDSLLLACPRAAKKVVFITGGALTAEVEAFLSACPAPVLRKPFAPDRLLALIASLTAQAPHER